ncbi:MAG: hypothetical protein JWR26_1422 [Pedosphaera sp.]|nr:hypothetical protein [Pedosphaera sp.]
MRPLFLIGGLCWYLFAFGFGVFVTQYIAAGAGLPFVGPMIWSGGVFIGMVHVIGLSTACLLCLAIGTGLFLHGMVPEEKVKHRTRLKSPSTNPSCIVLNPATSPYPTP